tara:strand:- start:2202 stop:3080 length:879 start_codon:yes stop_codon:yes gene_type:complete
MNKIFYIIFLFSNLIFSQDRTYLFYATPSGSDGWEISESHSFSEKFPITTYPLYDDYFLEKIHIYYILESESANIVVNIRKDNNGSPGEILEGASWDISLSGHGIAGAVEEYIFYTTSDCVYLEKDEFYWINLQSADVNSSIKWAYTSGTYYNYSMSHDGGLTWSPTETGNGGAAKISAEAVYYAPEINFSNAGLGDVNLDGSLNVLDVVALANEVLGNNNFTEEQEENADLNSDGSLNVLDVVALVNEILSPTIFSWTLEDINPMSNSYGELVGPPIYANKVSVYYFGKAG